MATRVKIKLKQPPRIRSSRPGALNGAGGRPGFAWRRRFPLLAATTLGLLVLLGAVFFLRAGQSPGSSALSVLHTADFHALTFSPHDPRTVFFGHHNGVLRSDDGGRSWQALVERPNFDAMGLAVNAGNSQQVFLAGHDVFQASDDGGRTWQSVPHNLPGTDIHGFAMSPDDPQHLFAYVVGHGIFESPDSGRSWQLLAGPRVGQVPGDIMALAAAGGSPETVYVGSMRAGVLKSSDGGRGWAPSSTGLGSRAVLALTVDPSSRQTLYAGVDGGLYKSTDGGSSWRKLSFPGDNAVALAVSPSQPNTVLAIAAKERQGFVFRSEDGGESWDGRP